MRERDARANREPMPEWVTEPPEGYRDAAEQWAIGAGYSPLEWLLATAEAKRKRRVIGETA